MIIPRITLLPEIMLLCALGNLAFFIWWWRAIRRVLILQRLLERICVDAFMRQSAPVWNAWADTHHKEIMVRISARDTGTDGVANDEAV
jgi:hypothetical protein